MTTIITRLYADTATARGVVTQLLAKGHDQDTIDVIGQDGAGTVAERLHAASVSPMAAAAYDAALTSGRALVVVRAPFSPIGTARNAMRVMDRTASIKVGVDENEYVRISPNPAVHSSVMKDHPFFMSNPHRAASHGHIFGAKLLSAHKERRSAIAGGAYISTKFWPMKLISAHKERRSAIHGDWFFSKFLGGLPLVTRN